MKSVGYLVLDEDGQGDRREKMSPCAVYIYDINFNYSESFSDLLFAPSFTIEMIQNAEMIPLRVPILLKGFLRVWVECQI